jgi:hypothetical protein
LVSLFGLVITAAASSAILPPRFLLRTLRFDDDG